MPGRTAPHTAACHVGCSGVAEGVESSARFSHHTTARQAGSAASGGATLNAAPRLGGGRHRASLRGPRPQGLTRGEAAATAPSEYATLASADGAPSGGETVGQLRRRSTAGAPPARRQRTAAPTACSLQSVSVC